MSPTRAERFNKHPVSSTPSGASWSESRSLTRNAWRTDGADWVQLDPPRHLVIQTKRSMSLLARQTGLTVDQVVYDSGRLHFQGNELYRQGYSLNSPFKTRVNR